MRRYFLTITIAMVGAIGLSMPLAHNDILAKADQRCFPETNICISGRIRQFWEEHGGLPILGFPITPQYEETIENGAFQVQWFERNRLELHPENHPPMTCC